MPASYLLVFGLLLAAPTLAQKEDTLRPKSDLIELRNGAKLEGRILAEDENSLCIEIGPGQRITLPKKQIASFLRLQNRDAITKRPVWPVGLGPRDDWFRLRDAEGKVVGTLRLICKAEKDGLFHLEESWLLFENHLGQLRVSLEKRGKKIERKAEKQSRRTATRLIRIERVDGELEPRACYYREQLVDLARDRTLYERIFDAEISHGYMRFKEQSTRGKQRQSLPFPAGSRLPLVVQERLRRGVARGAEAYHVAVFDPMEERFELRKFRVDDAAPVPAAFTRSKTSRRGQARQVEWKSDGRVHREWISAEGQVLRIECNGVHLVAEPVSEAYAQALERPEAERQLPSVQRFGEVELWLPRATWAFGNLHAGGQQLPIQAANSSAVVSIQKAERDPQQLLVGVAQDFLRRYRLEHEDFDSQSQELIEMDGRKAVRIDGQQKSAKGRIEKVRIYVFATKHLAYSLQGSCDQRQAERFLQEFADFAKGLRYLQGKSGN
ncbi:MAG: hypothetical protein CSA62_03400 [Planctomycetota bacterium]|nr:MAG: hypothetical protein CSA62_03400 [Planctomycetota bacterium]